MGRGRASLTEIAAGPLWGSDNMNVTAQNRQEKTDKRPPCAGLWSTPMVMVTGAVTTCCLDETLVNELGSLREHSLDHLWNGEEMQRWRLAQVSNDFEKSGPLCSSCNWRSAGAASPELVWSWLCSFERVDQSPPEDAATTRSARSIFIWTA